MLEVFTLNQHEEWDVIVRSFTEYDVYWLSGYVKAFQIHGDGEPLLFYVKEGGSRGINVVMKRDIALDKRFKGMISTGKYFDFATPYGYGGWIIEGNDESKIFESYNTWTDENGIICEFARFHPMIKNHEICSAFYDVVQLGEVVHMDLSSPEIIFKNIISKNRNMIRKAEKNNVKIYNGRFPAIFENFRNIYNSTMEKDKADKYYYFEKDFYSSLLEDLPQNVQVFWAEKDEKIIAASIILFANRRINYHLSGSIKEFGSLAPTNLLLYKTALWGNNNGYKTLYLGGGVGAEEDGLFKFKKSFNRNGISHFYVGRKIYDEKKYEALINMRNDITNLDFFPKYRG